MEEMMLKLNEFHHNHHPSGVKMLVNFIRRGFSVLCRCAVYIDFGIYPKRVIIIERTQA